MANGAEIVEKIKEKEEAFDNAVSEAKHNVEQQVQQVRVEHEKLKSNLENAIDPEKMKIFEKATQEVKAKKSEYKKKQSDDMSKVENIKEGQIKKIAKEIVDEIIG
ncbi:MAG: hypothetical protein Q8P90_02365 [bacterium]|nr:hypothetical protein [bacterium]